MNLRIPRRAEAQWLRCKAALREQLAPAGQAIGDSEIHSAAVAMLETCLRVGPGIIADEASPVYEAPPVPFMTPDDDDPVFHNLSGRSSDRIERAVKRRRHADITKRLDALGEKIDALVDALVGSKK